MAAKNDITGDAIRSKPSSNKYAEGWERIFGKKSVKESNLINRFDSNKETDDGNEDLRNVPEGKVG